MPTKQSRRRPVVRLLVPGAVAAAAGLYALWIRPRLLT